MPAKPKTYVPKSSGKAHTFPDGKQIIKLGFKAADLVAFVHANTNAKGYINLVVSERREMSQYGETHSIYLDDWQPKQGESAPAHNAAPATGDGSGDVPF